MMCPIVQGKKGFGTYETNFFSFSSSSVNKGAVSESCACFGNYSENSGSLLLFIKIFLKWKLIIYSNRHASLSPSIAMVEYVAHLVESHNGNKDGNFPVWASMVFCTYSIHHYYTI